VKLRRFPLHPGALYGVVKEVKAAVEDFRPIVLAGDPETTAELARRLAAGGDARALRDLGGQAATAYDLEGAGLLIYAIRGEEPSPNDDETLRLAERKGVEAICLIVGTTRTEAPEVAHVLATDVAAVSSGQPLPLDWIAERIAERTDERAYAYAARLPILRPAVCDTIVRRFSRQNGVLGAAIFIPGADLPVLTLNQVRMLLRIAAAYGEEIDRERIPELLAVVGAGFGFRALARQALGLVPGPGWAIKGGVAFAATRALGEAAVRYFEAGGQDRMRRSVRSRS
jgi:uncharacterized protein (DUF697 family)